MGTKITISQEGTNPISIEISDKAKSQEAMHLYASCLKYKTENDYLSSDKFINKLNSTFNDLESKGVTVLNKETIKPLKRSFGTALKEFFGGKQLTESDLFNSVKWIKVRNIDVCCVTNVDDSGFNNAMSWKDYFIWYTNDNKTCKAKRVGAYQMKGEHW